MKPDNKSTTEDVPLDAIFKHFESVYEFINTNLEDTSFKRSDLLEMNHSLTMNEFNKSLKKSTRNYTLLNTPIDGINAYVKGSQDVALYLIIELDSNRLDQIISSQGLPDNIETISEIQSKQFSFLHWDKKNYSIWLNRDVFGRSRTNSVNKFIVTVTNIPLRQLAYLGDL
jgi:hypothetical protein